MVNPLSKKIKGNWLAVKKRGANEFDTANRPQEGTEKPKKRDVTAAVNGGWKTRESAGHGSSPGGSKRDEKREGVYKREPNLPKSRVKNAVFSSRGFRKETGSWEGAWQQKVNPKKRQPPSLTQTRGEN